MNNEKFEQLKLNFLPRFWDIENKVMIYPTYDKNSLFEYFNEITKEYIPIHFLIRRTELFILNKPIGLKDKLGKLIYEGDILLIGNKYKRYVIWEKNRARFLSVNKDKEIVGFIYGERDNIPVEIIGNIHSNPEMIKE